MFKVDVEVKKLELGVRNEREVVEAMTERMLARVRERTQRGTGVDGAQLPRPKDGGQPLQRSGQLRASIGATVRETRSGVFVGHVKPLGPRTDVGNRAASAKVRTQMMRAAAVIGAFGQISATGSTPGRKAKGPGIKLARVRVRTADTNAALAGILSVPPKDLRGINGDRGTYRVFVASTREHAELAQLAQRTLVVALDPT
jgi:hypothetical protein